MSTDPKIQVNFAPGCFDNFEGTQEELDQLIKEITEKFSSMTLEDFDNEVESLEDLFSKDPEQALKISQFLMDNSDRKLQ